MEKWVYLEVWQYYLGDSNYAWQDSMGRTGPLAEVGQRRYPSISPLLNELGEQGWELVAVVRHGDDYRFLNQKYLLKRSSS